MNFTGDQWRRYKRAVAAALGMTLLFGLVVGFNVGLWMATHYGP